MKLEMKNISIGHKLGAEHKPMSNFEEYLLLHIGVVLIACGVYFFKFPNNFAIGGVSGIAVVLNHYIKSFSPSTLNMVFNIILLIVGIFFFGRNFGIKTAYATILLSLVIELLSFIVPMTKPLTNQPLLELVYAVILPGVGAGILFNIKASSGGTDVIAMILRKYTYIDIGKAIFVSDIIITLLSLVIFGPQTGLLSILGLITKSLLVDITIENINKVKSFEIVTEHPEKILEYITVKLHRGGTIVKGTGIYLGKEKTIINVVVNNFEGVLLRDYAKNIDPHCFITIFTTSQIIGKGFHNAN